MYISSSFLVAALACLAQAQNGGGEGRNGGGEGRNGGGQGQNGGGQGQNGGGQGQNGGGQGQMGGGQGRNATAQGVTPQGFTPSVSTKLELSFNSTQVKTPGELLSKDTTGSAPQIAVTGASTSDTYMFVMLDLDVPPVQGSTARRVLLHALETGFKATQQKMGAATVLASKAMGPAMYLPPGPPATDTMAHRYVQLLFKEPATINVKASDFANTTGRFNFDIQKFMTSNNLGAPLAGNFFTVDGRANGTAGGRGGSATSSGSGPRRTTVPFEGSAGRPEVSYGVVGILGGLAVLLL